MAIAHLALAGDMATLTFPRSLLRELGILINNQIQSDKVQVDIVNQTLIARTIVESERTARVEKAIDSVFEKYDDVFAELAKGTTK